MLSENFFHKFSYFLYMCMLFCLGINAICSIMPEDNISLNYLEFMLLSSFYMPYTYIKMMI